PEQVHVYLLDRATPSNASPHAIVNATPAEVAYLETRTFDASASTDDDGTIATVDWDFGDGSFASGVTVAHAYANAGTYWTRVTVRDDDGASATAYAESVVARTSLCPPAPV